MLLHDSLNVCDIKDVLNCGQTLFCPVAVGLGHVDANA